jgi:hypothetical protein
MPSAEKQWVSLQFAYLVVSHCTMQNNSLQVELLLARQIMFIYSISVTPVKNSAESLVTGNAVFHTVQFPFFLLYSFPDLPITESYIEIDVFFF